MNDLIEELIKTIDGAAQLYEKLRVVLERKQAAIVAGQTDELTQCAATEESLVDLAQRLDGNRVNIMGTLAQRLGVPGGQARLHQLAERLGEPWASRLLSLKDKLTQLVRKVQEINRVNALLVKDSLDFIGDVLRRCFHKQPAAGLVYGQKGRVAPVSIESRLVNLNA